MKTEETLEIEARLRKMCREKRLYGCEEVTIGFHHSGHGNEICDFMLMDSKGEVKCYEIKVTLQDLRSTAKKSWYGNLNYLVVSTELYYKIDVWKDEIPSDVGIIVNYKSGMESVRRAKQRVLSPEDETMVKESIIRSMYYKMDKFRRHSDGSTIAKAEKAVKSWKAAYDVEHRKYLDLCEEYHVLRHAVKQYKRESGIDLLQE